MKDLKHKIISLNKDQIHLILIRADMFKPDDFESLSAACNGIGLRALIVAVKDVNDVKVEEIGKIEIKMQDGKVIELRQVKG